MFGSTLIRIYLVQPFFFWANLVQPLELAKYGKIWINFDLLKLKTIGLFFGEKKE